VGKCGLYVNFQAINAKIQCRNSPSGENTCNFSAFTLKAIITRGIDIANDMPTVFQILEFLDLLGTILGVS